MVQRERGKRTLSHEQKRLTKRRENLVRSTLGGSIRPKMSSFWKLSLPKQWELDVNVKHHSQSVVLSQMKTGRGSLKLYGTFSGMRGNNLFRQ